MADESIWQQRVEDWRSSGLTARQFCAEHGLNQRTLSRWSQRLRREEPDASGIRLARLVRAPVVAATVEPSASPALVIEVGGVRVTVGHGADVATVVTVLAMVGAGGAR